MVTTHQKKNSFGCLLFYEITESANSLCAYWLTDYFQFRSKKARLSVHLQSQGAAMTPPQGCRKALCLQCVTSEEESRFTQVHPSETTHLPLPRGHAEVIPAIVCLPPSPARKICMLRRTDGAMQEGKAFVRLTSPLSSSLDIQPFLKFRRSGCGAQREQTGHRR